MNSYKLSWRVLSPYSTPPQSDTVFGHIAWAVVYLFGSSRLVQILERLEKEPVLVCSSLFPAGRLPLPALPVPHSVREAWLRQNGKDNPDGWREWTRLQKHLKKLIDLPAEMLTKPDAIFDWMDLIDLTAKEMREAPDKRETASKRPRARHSTIFHNTINRLTSTTDETTGGPYAEVAAWEAEGSVLQSWIVCPDDVLTYNELVLITEYITESGFGKNKSTGRGRMDVTIEPLAEAGEPAGEYWLLLSNTVPAPMDSTDCRYGSLAKFPRMGGGYALTESPFKKPVIVFTPGSVFKGAKPVGSLLKNIHPVQKDVVQNLYAYSIPIRIKEGQW